MKKILIQDLAPGLVKGVEVALYEAGQAEQNGYFEWKATPLLADFQTGQVSGGTLRSWRHEPLFNMAENHVDDEVFFFTEGTALMLFVDYCDGVPDMDTCQIVRILPGTQICIKAGKGHFVPVAEDDIPVNIIVMSPKVPAPKVNLPEQVLGVKDTENI